MNNLRSRFSTLCVFLVFGLSPYLFMGNLAFSVQTEDINQVQEQVEKPKTDTKKQGDRNKEFKAKPSVEQGADIGPGIGKADKTEKDAPSTIRLEQNDKMYSNAIEVYRDTINFLKWMITILIAIAAGFGIFMWTNFKKYETRTKDKISQYQQNAEINATELKKNIQMESKRVEVTGKMIIGISFINQQRIQDAIPYLVGTLENKELLSNEQLLIIHFSLGNIYCDLGNKPSARLHSEEALKINKNLSVVRLLLARVSQLTGNIDEAIKEFELGKKLAFDENHPPERLVPILIMHGNLLLLNKDYDKAKETFAEATILITKRLSYTPIGSPEWFAINQIKRNAEEGKANVEIRELLEEKYGTPTSQEEVNSVITWMRLLPFANTVAKISQIFDNAEFITLLKKIFNEELSRTPNTWEIISFGDKWLARMQTEKRIEDIIRNDLQNYPEYILRIESETKYNQLLKQKK